MMLIFLENAFNLGIFTHAPVLHSKHQAEVFENPFSPTAKRGGENYGKILRKPWYVYEDDL